MVVVYAESPISVLTDLQDFLLNKGADYKAPWEIEIKLYRANQASFKDEDKQRTLFTVWTSENKDTVWLLPREGRTAMTSPIKDILDTKLQSLWTPRQVFKGSGHTYMCSDETAVRVTNVFVQGSYKGLLLDVEESELTRGLCKDITAHFGIPEPKWGLDAVAQASEYLSVYK